MVAPENADDPIVATLSGMIKVSWFSRVFAKDLLPMSVSDSGNVIEAILVPENASSSIFYRLSLKTTDSMGVFKKARYGISFKLAKLTSPFRLLHSENAKVPMDVT